MTIGRFEVPSNDMRFFDLLVVISKTEVSGDLVVQVFSDLHRNKFLKDFFFTHLAKLKIFMGIYESKISFVPIFTI